MSLKRTDVFAYSIVDRPVTDQQSSPKIELHMPSSLPEPGDRARLPIRLHPCHHPLHFLLTSDSTALTAHRSLEAALTIVPRRKDQLQTTPNHRPGGGTSRTTA